MWRRLCEVLELSSIADDPRFTDVFVRVQNRKDLDAILEKAFVRRTAAEWVETLNAAGVACGPINTLDQVFADPQVKLAGLVHEVANAEWGPHKVLGVPVTLSRTPPVVRHAAPATGEHTRETLASLGYSAETIDTLIADGVVGVAGQASGEDS
jgi:crotonobetainyl-CoA:carnitine CoA-transferase CaiB-like acyl-CoA transferase